MPSLILAFGIFFTLSCSTLHNTETADSSENDESTLQHDIDNINQEISENPDEVNLQAEKANLLYRYSQTIPDPETRKTVYLNIRDIADNYSLNPEIAHQLDEILSSAWHTEQQSGIRLLQKDQYNQSGEIAKITSHFENAITLIPDSLQTYYLLATTHYQNRNLNQAIETLEQAEDQQDQYNPAVSEKLAYLYLESGNLREAEQRYRNLTEFDPDKLLYKHGLINVLILSDKHEETIEMLEELSDEYPTRYFYQESLGSELYYLFKEKTETVVNNNNENLSRSQQRELAELLSSMHTIFDTIRESLPASEENTFRMASFYKNASERLNKLPDNNVRLSTMEQEFMEHSLPLWEQLAETNPENLGYLNNLYQVYLALEMQEEAESIGRSYNF